MDNDLTVGDKKITHEISVKTTLLWFLNFNSRHLKNPKAINIEIKLFKILSFSKEINALRYEKTM